MIRQRLFVYAFGVAAVVLSFCGASAATLMDIARLARDTTPNVENNEPSIAVNPRNPNQIAVVAFSGQWSQGISVPVWKSDDGGASWRRVSQIPQPALGQIGPLDQNVAFDRNGNLYVAELATDAMHNRQDYIYRPVPREPDAPMVPGPSYVAEGQAFQTGDQPFVALDQSASNCFGHIYSPVSDLRTFLKPTSRVATSTVFNSTVTVNETPGQSNPRSRTTRVAVAPDGKVYIVFKTETTGKEVDSYFERANFNARRSDTCGRTWMPPASVTNGREVETYFTRCFGAITPCDHPNPLTNVAYSSDAWIAVAPDGTGEVYVSYVNRDIVSGHAQIYVARSTTLGASWTTARVTDGTHNSAFPEIAAAGAGAIGVLYVDYETSGGTTTYRHHLAVSHDHGQTWEDEILQTMDPSQLKVDQKLLNRSPGFIWGDYEGLVAAGSQYYGVFTGQSIGRANAQLDPIFFTAPAYHFKRAAQPHVPSLFLTARKENIQ